MCGRVVCNLDSATLAYIANARQMSNEEDYNRSFNIAPTSNLPVVCKKNGLIHLQVMKWGRRNNSENFVINARIESFEVLKEYKMQKETSRCYVIVEGYYEWKGEESDKNKQPYYIFSKEKPFLLLAGIYSWNEELEVNEVLIITTAAFKEIDDNIHHRMPLFINEEFSDKWIDCENHAYNEIINDIIKFNDPYSDRIHLSYHEVGDLVNKLSNKSKDNILKKSLVKYNKDKIMKLNNFFIIKSNNNLIVNNDQMTDKIDELAEIPEKSKIESKINEFLKINEIHNFKEKKKESLIEVSVDDKSTIIPNSTLSSKTNIKVNSQKRRKTSINPKRNSIITDKFDKNLLANFFKKK